MFFCFSENVLYNYKYYIKLKLSRKSQEKTEDGSLAKVNKSKNCLLLFRTGIFYENFD